VCPGLLGSLLKNNRLQQSVATKLATVNPRSLGKPSYPGMSGQGQTVIAEKAHVPLKLASCRLRNCFSVNFNSTMHHLPFHFPKDPELKLGCVLTYFVSNWPAHASRPHRGTSVKPQRPLCIQYLSLRHMTLAEATS